MLQCVFNHELITHHMNETHIHEDLPISEYSYKVERQIVAASIECPNGELMEHH